MFDEISGCAVLNIQRCIKVGRLVEVAFNILQLIVFKLDNQLLLKVVTVTAFQCVEIVPGVVIKSIAGNRGTQNKLYLLFGHRNAQFINVFLL